MFMVVCPMAIIDMLVCSIAVMGNVHLRDSWLSTQWQLAADCLLMASDILYSLSSVTVAPS